MTAQEWLDELGRLREAATPGPWAYEQHGDTEQCGVGVILDDNNEQIFGVNNDTTLFLAESIAPEVNCATNAAYIVAACNALPRLVEMLRLAVGFLDAVSEYRRSNGEFVPDIDVMQLLFTKTEPKK